MMNMREIYEPYELNPDFQNDLTMIDNKTPESKHKNSISSDNMGNFLEDQKRCLTSEGNKHNDWNGSQFLASI